MKQPVAHKQPVVPRARLVTDQALAEVHAGQPVASSHPQPQLDGVAPPAADPGTGRTYTNGNF